MPKYHGLKGLDKLSYKGLSIIYITAFLRPVQIIRQTFPNLKMGISPFAQYHQSNGLSRLSQYVRRLQTTVYKEIPNTPIYTYKTISSGIWAYKRFGYEGLDNMAK